MSCASAGQSPCRRSAWLGSSWLASAATAAARCRHRGCFGQPSLDVVDALQGIGGGPPGVDVPLLHVGEQGLPNRRQGKVEAGADGVAALVPTFWGAGGDDPRRLVPGLFGWQAGEPFVDESVRRAAAPGPAR